MSDTYRAMVASEHASEIVVEMANLSYDDLPEGDVTVAVHYSTLNYKDGLALKGNQGKIMRRFPMVPGIDFAGVVESSESSMFAPGDEVILTGWGLGETHPGGFAQKARVDSQWIVEKPDGLTLSQTMALGTAGLTAMLSVMALEDSGVVPQNGEVLVTGAAGGVGSVAVAILAELGYDVAASTGRPETGDYLRGLGANTIVGREELEQQVRPMLSERWAGAVDTVGGQILGSVMPSIKYAGAVAACGNAAGIQVPLTVLPFILRGIRLLGIESTNCPIDRRCLAWARLASTLPPAKIDAMSTTRSLSDVLVLAEQILNGRIRGRTIVDVGQA